MTEKFTSEEIIEAFTEGDCWALALHLHKKYPVLEIVVAGWEDKDDDERPCWCHVMCYDPTTDQYVDIEGVRTLEDVKKDFIPERIDMFIEKVDSHTLDWFFRENIEDGLWFDVPVEVGESFMLDRGWVPPEEQPAAFSI